MSNEEKESTLKQVQSMRFVLSEAEAKERERLLELQQSKTRWFSQQEFDRLKQLNDKMSLGMGSFNTASSD
jgi:hypothetical protein